jgi:hypothetical protein
MEQNDQVPRSPIQDPIELPSIVAAEFSELALDLGSVREREVDRPKDSRGHDTAFLMDAVEPPPILR